jgi:hypothetical protein
VARLLIWEALEEDVRIEAASVELADDGLTARGTQIGTDPLPYRLDYRLDATGAGFATRALRVEAAGEGWGRRLRLERSDDREWTIEVGGEGEVDLPAPGGDEASLAGALDCDLGLSPLTNSMPIRRHRLDEGPGEANFTMAWVSVPDLAVVPSGQRYTHLRRDDNGAVVRFADTDGRFDGFTAELELDPDGFVRFYPELARRV